jgi:plasmid maintenance system antidote protein VapI
MAVRPEQAFGRAAQTWLQMQANYALAQARQRNIRLERYGPAIAANEKALL